MKKPRKKHLWKGKAFRFPAGTQDAYTRQVVALTEKMTTETTKKLTELFNKSFAQEHFHKVSGDSVGMDAPSISSQARMLMNALMQKYDQLFGKLAFGLSPWMVDNVNRASANQSRGVVDDMPNLKDEGGKLTIDVKTLDAPTKQILKASSARSTSFIKTVPERFLNSIQNEVYESITNGNGMQDLVPALEKHSNQTRNWAHNTAMDQTRKTFNGLNKGRMQKIGIEKGEWIHSGGSNHPRPLHQDFDGQTFNLAVGAPVGDDGGNNVDPGEEPNCRCTFAPVVDFDDED